VSDAAFLSSLRLGGRHVELVPLDKTHVSDLVPGLLDRATVELLRAPPGPTPDEAAAWIQRWIEVGRVGPDLPFATVLRATGRPVGMTAFTRLDRPSRGVEIGGTWLTRDFWRTPVNTEAKWLMLRYAFEEGGMHRVQLQTDLRNVRSQRAIEGLGAAPEARLREDVLLQDGSYRTSVYYSILEAEWPTVRKRLEDRLARSWAPPPVPSTSAETTAASGPRTLPPAGEPPLIFRAPVTLRGDHITLEPLQSSQLPELIPAGADPRIWSLLRIRHGDTPEGMTGLVDELLALQDVGQVLPFAVRLRHDGRLCGIARYLDIDRENRWVEVGTWLNPSVWRSTVNTELKFLLLRHAFETESVHRVQLKTDDRNVRSQQAIERLGAVFEGQRRDHYRFPNGVYRTSKYYSILASEWPQVRRRLEEMLLRPWPSTPTTSV
jgi:RimJ/RimL family protein N-acetyltransferase